MGILEISAEMLKLSGAGDYSEPWILAGLLYLIAILFLVRQLKPPRKEDRLL